MQAWAHVGSVKVSKGRKGRRGGKVRAHTSHTYCMLTACTSSHTGPPSLPRAALLRAHAAYGHGTRLRGQRDTRGTGDVALLKQAGQAESALLRAP